MVHLIASTLLLNDAFTGGYTKVREVEPESSLPDFFFSKSIEAGEGKSQRMCSPQRTREVNGASENGIGIAVNPGIIAEKLAGTTFSPIMTTTPLVKSSPTSQICPAMPGEVWLQVYACI